MSTAPPLYQWQTLAENHIRLFEIVPGTEDSPLHFVIEHHDLASLPGYEAISYAVGDGSMDRVCYCQGNNDYGNIYITTSLWLALQDFRRRKGRMLVWADQICIDQDNAADKARQIPLMSNIFGSATVVFVWLGPANEDTAQAFSLIYNLSRQIYGTGQFEIMPISDTLLTARAKQLQLPHRTAPEWTAFRNLFRRSWFRRQWCFQEIVTAKKAAIVCGSFDILWDAFMDVLQALLIYDYSNKPSPAHINSNITLCLKTALCRHSYQRGERVSNSEWRHLMSLVVLCMDRKATLPHDKIYALLGCATRRQIHAVPIDYQQHFRSLYTDFTRMILEEYRDLSLLSQVQISDTTIGPREMPHWVPDYRHKQNSQDKLGSHARWKHGKKCRYNATGTSRAVISGNSSPFLLSLQGFHVGTISKITEPRPQRTDESFVDSFVATGGVWESLARECCTDGIYSPTGESIEMAYARMRMRGRPPGEKTQGDRRAARKRPPIAIPEPNSQTYGVNQEFPDSHDNSELTMRILSALSQRKFFIADSGYFGLANRSCLVGDRIFILLGANVPFVLRKLSTGTDQYAGQAYVHGIMDGEYLLRFRQDTSGVDAITDDEWLDSLGDENPPPLPTIQVTLS